MKTIKILFTFIIVAFVFNSCASVNGAHGENASHSPKTFNYSENEFNLNVSDNPIEYTIDISTEDGRNKLKGLSVKQAEELALREAIMKNGCASIFNPQYTHLLKGKRVLRVTVYGFPAHYRNE